MHRLLRSFLALTAASLVVGPLAPASASPSASTGSVTSATSFGIGTLSREGQIIVTSQATSANSCLAVAVATFPEVVGFQGGTANYTYRSTPTSTPQNMEAPLTPPYDDVFTSSTGAVFTAPAGLHQKVLLTGGGTGFTDCSDVAANLRSQLSPTATTVYYATAACAAVYERLEKAFVKVDKARAVLKAAKGKARDAAKLRLKKVAKKLKKAKKAHQKVCGGNIGVGGSRMPASD